MKQYHDRRPEILQFLQPYMEERFQETCRQMQTEIEKNGHAIWNELKETINELLLYVDKMQKQHKKGKIKYFVCSFLRSSIYLERLEFYIHVMDEGFYLDEQETGAYYCPQFIQKPYLEDINYLHEKAAEKFMRMQKYERYDINEEYIEFYDSLMYKMMESVSELIMETIEKSGIPMSEDFKVIYGEYMGNAAILYEKGGCKDEILSDRDGRKEPYPLCN